MSADHWGNLAGLAGSAGWGVWVAALGVTVLLRPATAARSASGRLSSAVIRPGDVRRLG